MQESKKRRDASVLTCKLVLLVLFLFAVALIAGGVLGGRNFAASGFDQETAFGHIEKLGKSLNAATEQDLLPAIQALPADRQQALQQSIRRLLADSWSAAAKSDRSAQADTAVAASADPDRTALRLLAITDAVAGPKISTAQKKALAALSDADRSALRTALLQAVIDPASALPAPLTDADAKAKTDADRAAIRMQLYFVSAHADGQLLPEDQVIGLKKDVRAAEARETAYTWAESGCIGVLQQLIVSHSTTLLLLGILLLLNVLLLTLLLGRDHNWHLDFKWFIILAIVDFMLVFQMLPMIYLVTKALFPDGSFSLRVMERLYSYPMNQSALVNTLITAFATMVLGTLIAFPLAWLVGRTNLYGRKFFRSLFVLTYMVPPYVGAMAWLRLLNPNVGTINQLLRLVMGMGDTPGPINIYSIGGIIWVLTTFYYPYAFITISRAMEKMDPSLEEASRISGASPLSTVFRVTLPMMTPSLIAGALLVFVGAASAYGIPSIIGAPGKVHTVTTRIIEYNGLGTQGLSDATGLAVFLMVLAIIILYVSDFVVAKKQYITVSGKSTRPNIVDLRQWRVPLTVAVSLFAFVVILLPFAIILITSFKTDVGKTLWDVGNFTTVQWQTIFSRGETKMSLMNSIVFAAITATIGIVVACTMSYLLQRTRIRGRKIPDFMITLGSGTPSVVIALGLIMTMKGDFGVSIYNTAYIIIIAYLIKYLMMGMRTVVSAMSQIHVSLEECSQISGASWLRTMVKITGPLIFPSIAAGWFLIFIPSFYELSMTTLLYSNTTKTIGFQLYEYWTFTSQPQACAMAFGILLIVVALNFALNKLTKGEFSI